MADAAETMMVAEYVLGSNQRLNAALAIYDAYDEIRRPVIKKFVSDLRDAITSALNAAAKEWAVNVQPDEDWTWKRDCRLTVRHEAWQDGQYVGVGAAKYGPADLWFGVWGISDERLAQQILSHLNQRVAAEGWAAPTANPPRQWCYNFGNLFERRWELGDWRRTAAVQAMHEGKDGDYHKRTLDTIVEIARATDEILRDQVDISKSALKL